jgi:hypothetical protein
MYTTFSFFFYLMSTFSPKNCSSDKYYSRSTTTKTTNFILDEIKFQYLHKQVPTKYFSMMFNIYKHISHLLFVFVPECGEYEICNQKIMLRSISRQRPFSIDVVIARADMENCYQNSSWGKGLIKSRNNESNTFHL